ncbi:hypothetical protein [Streptomyces sp. VNUA74]|uniref:hypothetical protein n=1 Tax=Streptomyces sp. VNUA74 TaxID=3062685 RepID=UPI00280BC49B|nr:hypothetical protein [Streptomyces sp. VNUA74]WML79164.1 hypothetical protein Q3101_04625 [Streptomyces sp. VNUA74]
MSDLWVAVIAAGSAVAGAAVGGWFARSAGIRQAEAAKHAGDRQADAALHIMQATLDDQRRTRVEERRRQTYLAFLKAADDLTGDANNDELQLALSEQVTRIAIEGPHDVFMKASAFQNAVFALGSRGYAPMGSARLAYIQAVRGVLGIADDDPDIGTA